MGNLGVIISNLLHIQSKHGTKAFLRDPCHLAGLVSPTCLTLLHQSPVSQTHHSDSSEPVFDYSVSLVWKAFLVHLGFTAPNTTNVNLESLLKAIPEYCQQIHKQFPCSLCSLFILPPK